MTFHDFLRIGKEVLPVVKDMLTILAILVGGYASLFIFFQLAPVLTLQIVTKWADEKRDYLIVQYVIKNASRVRVYKPRGQIQALKYDPKVCHQLSHWVPFEKEKIKAEEPPVEWQEPVKIFETTGRVYPGESVTIERLYHVLEKRVIIHIGLQVGIKLTVWGRLVTRKREPWRQTTTCVVVKIARIDL